MQHTRLLAVAVVELVPTQALELEIKIQQEDGVDEVDIGVTSVAESLKMVLKDELTFKSIGR